MGSGRGDGFIEDIKRKWASRQAEEQVGVQVPKPERYLVRAFTSCAAMQAWLNSEEMVSYRAVGIADTDDYVTVLCERVPASGSVGGMR